MCLKVNENFVPLVSNDESSPLLGLLQSLEVDKHVILANHCIVSFLPLTTSYEGSSGSAGKTSSFFLSATDLGINAAGVPESAQNLMYSQESYLS